MPKNRLARILLIIAFVLLVAVLLWVTRPAPAVEVTRPQIREVVELVIDSGFLRASTQSELGSDGAGIVDRVLVSEGDRVTAGQTVIALDRGTAQEQLQRAELAAQTAQRQLEQVNRPALASDIARARAELRQAQQSNSAVVAQAQQRLNELERGGRPEAIAQAQANLRQAQANRQQAELDFRRAELLFSRGAIPRADVDRARTALTQARAAEQNASQALALARQPASREEIEAARAELRAAQANLQGSVQSAQENLRTLLSQPRPEDVAVARSQLREAQAAVRQARLDLSQRTIYSPISGVVIQRNAEPGQSIVPGQGLLTIADMSRTEVFVETDETNLPRLRVGQRALIIAPAYPTRPFPAVLFQIGPQVNTERGVVGLRLRPEYLPSFARPDMTVDVNIEVARFPRALSVPISSVIEQNGRAYVYTVENGRVVRRDIESLGRGANRAAIRGLDRNAQVVVQATRVSPGQRVRAR